jgi:aryl-alcohol dehydrogenase-like predicted oxidoreductase/histidinol phosphatase-like enzyme
MADRRLTVRAGLPNAIPVSIPTAMPTIGLGCMRLSTSADRDDARSIRVIRAALDAGATLLDTADAYCLNDDETGHNERLIATALGQWGGDRASIEVATKGGLRRPGGKWVADGKAKALRAACDASRRALDADVIDCYQLHAVDPNTPLETSVRALATLQSEGKIRRIGLCNVTVGQIETAREIAEIASVQVSLGALDDENLRNGVAEYCRDHGIRLIAYRPLGGEKTTRLARDPVLVSVAGRHGATPHEIALAWLMDLSSLVVPIPGATREETARSIRSALDVRLTDADRRELDDRFSGRLLRVPRSRRRPAESSDGEVVLVMGMPGAGKTSVAIEMEALGYGRLNRDLRGGSLADLVPELDAGLASGQRRWVLDNTYPTRRSRNEVIECAWTRGVPVRCVWVTTSVADAQINAITRMIEVAGRLPTVDELRARGKDDPRFFGPDAQFRYERTLEPPVSDEGFVTVDQRPFARQPTPHAHAKAVVFDYDELVSTTADGGAVSLIDGRADELANLGAEGWLLLAHAWRPQIARGKASLETLAREFAGIRELLRVELEIAVCPHDAGPPICWCRKPLPGSILEFALRRAVDLSQSVVVGSSAADRTMAARLGMTHRNRAKDD